MFVLLFVVVRRCRCALVVVVVKCLFFDCVCCVSFAVCVVLLCVACWRVGLRCWSFTM